MNEVTIVTAFFDIGRSEIAGFNRTNEQYFDYFKFWGGLKNRLIVYANQAMADKVLEYRQSLGLAEQTKVVVVENIYDLEPEIYQAMLKVEQDPDFLHFRLDPKAIENQADYNYVMLMKYWCLQDAHQRQLVATPMVAWLDFGFNHGGKAYTKSEEFRFLWQTELSEEFVHIFSNGLGEKMSIIKQVQFLSQNGQGGIIIAGATKVEAFYRVIKQAVWSLLNLDLNDDDQTWLLMSAKMAPDLVRVHTSDWFMPLKEHGADFLTVKEKTIIKPGLVLRLRQGFHNWRCKRRFLKQVAHEYDKIFTEEKR